MAGAVISPQGWVNTVDTGGACVVVLRSAGLSVRRRLVTNTSTGVPTAAGVTAGAGSVTGNETVMMEVMRKAVISVR